MASKLKINTEALSVRDKIMGYLKASNKADIFLTEKEEEYMVMIDYADDIIRAHPGSKEKDYVNMLMAKYDIHVSKARDLLNDTRYIHGTTQRPVKAYERARLNEYLWKIMDHCYSKEKFKEAIQAGDLLYKLNGLYDMNDEEQLAEPEHGSGPVVLQPAFAPETLGVPLPENVDELIQKLRSRTKIHRNILTNGE